jgi:hypothetical protein
MIDALRGTYREEGARPPGAFLADRLRIQNAKRLESALKKFGRIAAQAIRPEAEEREETNR